jgi:hypothetical protein
MADRKLYLIQRNMLALWRHWVGVRPWRVASWLGLAYEAGQVVRAASRGRARVAWRAKRAAGGVAMERPDLARGAGRRRLLAWLGVAARPIRPELAVGRVGSSARAAAGPA